MSYDSVLLDLPCVLYLWCLFLCDRYVGNSTFVPDWRLQNKSLLSQHITMTHQHITMSATGTIVHGQVWFTKGTNKTSKAKQYTHKMKYTNLTQDEECSFPTCGIRSKPQSNPVYFEIPTFKSSKGKLFSMSGAFHDWPSKQTLNVWIWSLWRPWNFFRKAPWLGLIHLWDKMFYLSCCLLIRKYW